MALTEAEELELLELEEAEANGGAVPTDTPSTPFVPSGEKEYPSLLDPDMIAANPAVRAALGAASPILGTLQVGGKITDKIYKATGIPFRPGEGLDEYINRTDQLVQQGRAKVGSEGIDWPRLLGTVFSPAFLKLLKLRPAKTVTGKLAQGSAVGAAAGATTPVEQKEGDTPETFAEDFAKRKASQIGTGAVVGAAIPGALIPASKIASMAYHGVIEPWAAPAAIKGRAFLEAAGDKADDVIRLLRSGGEEIVPGSAPTAGQAAAKAGSAEFSAMQKAAENVKPSEYVARTDAQNAARLDAVRGVGKDEAALKAAEQARATTTGQMYEEAYSTMVKRDPMLRELWKNPFFRKAIPDAWELAKANNISPRKNLTEFLHFVKVGLDNQLAAGPAQGTKALSSMQRKAVQEVKKNLVSWIEMKNPAYEGARTTFAEMSAPINQMKVGQALEDKLVPALSEEAKQSAAQYSNALRDAPKTIQKATGGPRFQELKDVLTPDQVKAVESVQADLARNVRYEELARKGASTDAARRVTKLATEEYSPKINLLDRGMMVANAIIDRVQGRLDKKLAAEIAVEMLNPQGVGESMAKAKARAAFNARVANELHQAMRVAIVAGAAGKKEKK